MESQMSRQCNGPGKQSPDVSVITKGRAFSLPDNSAVNFAPAMIYWFTGQPGAGKSTLARALKMALESNGKPAVHIDGEALREIMANVDYSRPGRVANMIAAQKLAALIRNDGISVVASFVSPFRDIREKFKKNNPVLEIYVHTHQPRGREDKFAKDYEPPLESFLDLDTTNISVAECVERVLRAASNRHILQ